MRTTFFTLFSILCFLSINQLQAQDKEWTIIAYVVGTDIVQDAITDLGEMKAAQPTDNVNIVALRGGANLTDWTSPKPVELRNGQEFDLDFTAPDSDMAGPANITAFIDYAITNFPAQKYMLVFYNHGMDVRGFGWDETVDAQSSVGDIQAAIGSTNYISQGNKFEVIGFDACLMASFEVMSTLRNYGKYYVASEEEEPWHAWSWTPVVTAMNTQPGLTGDVLGQIIVDNFIQHAQNNNTNHVTLSTIDLSKITALESSIETLFGQLDDDLYRDNLIKSRKDAEEYGKNMSPPELSEDMVDIGDLVTHLRVLEPGISTEIDDVLAKLNDAVVYHRSDAALPNANGIAMFLPLRKLADEDEANFFISDYINDIDYSSSIKSFIVTEYMPYAFSNDSPLQGIIDNNFGLRTEEEPDSRDLTNTGVYSAINLPEHDQLDHVQVVLLEEIEGDPGEYILLGSSYEDTIAVNTDGSLTFAYEWDEEWLGINGFPAYIADIQLIDIFDDEGNLEEEFYRIHVPALLNPGTADEKEIQFTFRFDEDFNHELESIMRERYGVNDITGKDRIRLQPGDRVQLEYEIFDVATNEAYFVPEPGAIIEIVNGNEDIDLQHVPLPEGRYHLGFVIMDHFQNDTLIYDPTVHEIMMVDTDDPLRETLFASISPNPVKDMLQLQFNTALSGSLELYDLHGRTMIRRQLNNAIDAQLNMSKLPSGTYWLRLYDGQRTLTERIVKP